MPATIRPHIFQPSRSPVLILIVALLSPRSSRYTAPRASEHVHFARGRANKLRSVSESLISERAYRSDQGKVWDDIDEKFSSGLVSETAAEADVYEHQRNDLATHLAAFAPKPNQCGVVVGVGCKVVGLDIFATPSLFEKLNAKVLSSYLLDALEVQRIAEPPPTADIQASIQGLFASPERRFPSPGTGETYRWSNSAGEAAALVVDRRCVHAVAFCTV